jgi:hypothetical protein
MTILICCFDDVVVMPLPYEIEETYLMFGVKARDEYESSTVPEFWATNR